MNDKWKSLIADVAGMYGYHGGMGDPPDDATIIAIAKGTLGHVLTAGDPDEPEAETDDEPEETRT
jgi:hypothetical protein